MLRPADLPPTTARAWIPALGALALGLVVILVAFADTWRAMAGVWWVSETFGHGLLVAPISAWLIWRRRAQLAALQPSPSWLGVAMLAAACIAWLAAELAGINVVAQFAVTGMLVAMAVTVLGWRIAWSIAFPLAFLFFMVPAGEALNPPLMDATAEATIRAIQAVGIPVFREGLHFTLPTGRWSVVEACSGLRYIIASAVLASLFAYLNFRRFHKQAIFVLVALAIAVLANWIRAFLIVMLGHFSGMTLGVGDDHVVYGWIFYGVVMFAVFWMGTRWRDEDAATDGATASWLRGSQPAWTRPGRGGRGALPAVICAMALGVVALTWVGLRELRDVQPHADLAARAASAVGPLQPGAPAVQPRFEGARGTLQGVLDPASGTDLYLAYFARQGEGAEMIAFGNAVLADTDKTWQTMTRTQRTVEIDGASLPVTEWRVRSGQSNRMLWSWYTVGGTHANSDYRAKGLTALAMLSGRGDHSTVAVVGTRLDDGTEPAGDRELDAARARLSGAAQKASRLATAVTSR